MRRDTYNYKRHVIKAAKELFYPKEIISRLHSFVPYCTIRHEGCEIWYVMVLRFTRSSV